MYPPRCSRGVTKYVNKAWKDEYWMSIFDMSGGTVLKIITIYAIQSQVRDWQILWYLEGSHKFILILPLIHLNFYYFWFITLSIAQSISLEINVYLPYLCLLFSKMDVDLGVWKQLQKEFPPD